MNNSTTGVTLYSGFILDLLHCYEHKTFAQELYDMAPEIDPNDPTKPVPIEIYNAMCQWIEDRLGAASMRKAGMAIGDRAYDQMIQAGMIGDKPTPLDILQGLKTAAAMMIQDPLSRGWEIRESSESRIVMRRTQTFNCVLQEGLLKSLVTRTGVSLPGAEHIACTREGAEYCDYAATWLA